MRLLNVHTLEVEEFLEKHVPIYVILSHTWEAEEVLFDDMADLGAARRKRGFAKVQSACNLARQQNYYYIWIDTCCIDKSSSAELSEAINSMFQWYKDAAVCYAFLSDVVDGDIKSNEDDSFRASRWWTRGWTLQEMIAPSKLQFYGASWEFLGWKTDDNVCAIVAEISGVDEMTLRGADLEDVSIARRMYWASYRQTTRVEDAAYSLLGIFDVNMPLIYGEGRKAFRRLQEEILSKSDDVSIFAWFNTKYSEGTAVDVLATSPEDFRESGLVAREPFRRAGRRETMITNQGIVVELPIISVRRAGGLDDDPFGEIEAILDCQLGHIPGTFPSIRLRSTASGTWNTAASKHYHRIMTGEEMGKFEYFSSVAFINDEYSVLGLDPTQLDKEEYKKAMGKCISVERVNHSFVAYEADYTNLMWKIESVILTRRIPQASPSAPAVPWSLSPLQHHYAPDNSRFWFLNYGCYHPDPGNVKVHISRVYPTDQWDSSAHQLRVLPVPQHCFGMGSFRCVDALFEIRLLSRFGSTNANSEKGMLLVGRVSDSRRDLYIKPWCKFVEGASISKAASFVEKFRRYIWSEDCVPESSVELTAGPWKTSIKTTVQTKEISGVFYHVVGTRPVGNGYSDRELSLHEPLHSPKY